MKRARTEQIQTTTLTHLKKRKNTDSETTFRQNFRFEESIEVMTQRFVQGNKASSYDTVALSVCDLSDYFHAFNDFIEFVRLQTKNKLSCSLSDLLCPLFVHSYLDLIVAGRTNEAAEFYTHFAADHLSPDLNETVLKLKSIHNALDLDKHFEITKIRNQFCKVKLDKTKKNLLERYLNDQGNLVIVKLLNERIQFTDIDTSPVCEITLPETSSKKDSQTQSRLLGDVSNETHVETSSATKESIIISPPSLTALSTSFKTMNNLMESSTFSTAIEQDTLRKKISLVDTQPPDVPRLLWYKFTDSNALITDVSMSNNQKYICSALDDASIQMWNVQEKCANMQGQDNRSMTVNPSPDIQTNVAIVSFGSDYKEDVQQLLSFGSKKHSKNLYQDPCMTTLRAHSGTVYGSCFTSKDDYMLSCSEDTTIRLWDMKDFTNKASYNGHNLPVFSIALSDFDMYFASGSYDCTAKLWTFDRTFPIRAFAGHQQAVHSVAFHSNVSYLATADTSVRLWDISSGKTVRLMTGHWAPVVCLSFSPNGRWLASAGEDSRIRVWDIASGSLWKEMRGHAESVYGLQFSPDSSLLSSCGADGCVNVWNVKASSTIQTTTMDKADNPHLVGQWTADKSSSVLCTRFTANNLLKCVAVQV